MKNNRVISFIIILFSYLVAAAAGLFVYANLPCALWLRILVADLAATAVIWIFSLIFDNASIYDPYWSLQPIVILNFLLWQTGVFAASSLLLCLVVNLWGIRLTANWAITFRGLNVQDWRYDLIKDKVGWIYPLANLLGIQMMPTLVVYTCLLPAIIFVTEGGGFSLLTAAGLLVSLCGLLLESISDWQMHAFRRQTPDRTQINRSGLWHNSRHPNYLGEIMMWWGVYLVMLSVYPQFWYLGLGAVLNTALFIFISIPMNEKRLAAYKHGFGEYREQTRVLLPLRKK